MQSEFLTFSRTKKKGLRYINIVPCLLGMNICVFDVLIDFFSQFMYRCSLYVSNPPYAREVINFNNLLEIFVLTLARVVRTTFSSDFG